MRKNVLITGAGGGIGVSICETLIKKYYLILVGRNIEKLEGLMKGEKFVLKRIACDLKSIDEIKKLYEKITKDNLPIDILVNNAGITDDSLFIRMNFEKWDNVNQDIFKSSFNNIKDPFTKVFQNYMYNPFSDKMFDDNLISDIYKMFNTNIKFPIM